MGIGWRRGDVVGGDWWILGRWRCVSTEVLPVSLKTEYASVSLTALFDVHPDASSSWHFIQVEFLHVFDV